MNVGNMNFCGHIWKERYRRQFRGIPKITKLVKSIKESVSSKLKRIRIRGGQTNRLLNTLHAKTLRLEKEEEHFVLFSQQIVLTIRGLGLEGYLDGSLSAPSKTSRNRAGEEILNPHYLQFLKQDNSLASWLLSTISPHILPQLVGAETTASIWAAVTKKYSSLSTTKVMNLHCRLRSMKKGTQSIHEYTMAIKQTCDLLASCGS
ncbi:hypothetical protein GQ457_08G000710 [Hibiscus cannabinus]